MIIMLRLLQIQTIAVAMQMSRKTLLHVVDICAAKITRILPPVGERMGTWGLCANGSVDAGLWLDYLQPTLAASR